MACVLVGVALFQLVGWVQVGFPCLHISHGPVGQIKHHPLVTGRSKEQKRASHNLGSQHSHSCSIGWHYGVRSIAYSQREGSIINRNANPHTTLPLYTIPHYSPSGLPDSWASGQIQCYFLSSQFHPDSSSLTVWFCAKALSFVGVIGLYLVSLTKGNLLAHIIRSRAHKQSMWRNSAANPWEQGGSSKLRCCQRLTCCFSLLLFVSGFHSFSQLSGLVNLVGNTENDPILHLMFSIPREDLHIFFLHLHINKSEGLLGTGGHPNTQRPHPVYIERQHQCG